jgi:uncharacterized protein
MRTFLLASLLLISNVLLAQRYSSLIKNRPVPAKVVNDWGSFLTYTQKNNLERDLIDYRRQTGNTIVIITLNTLPYTVEETALRYFNKWGIGDSKKNNGILILVSREPRRIRITTGKGVERKLTDYDCQQIVDDAITPSFRAGLFYNGLKDAVTDIKRTLAGEPRSNVQTEVQDNTQYDNGSATSQSLAQTQPLYTPTQRKPMTAGQIIGSILFFALLVFGRVLYIRSNRPDPGYAEDGTPLEDNSSMGMDILKATGWALMVAGILVVGIFIILFKFFALFGGGSRRSSYCDGHYHRHGWRSSGSSFSGGGGSSSGGGGGSFGGGVSGGGGASGSW